MSGLVTLVTLPKVSTLSLFLSNWLDYLNLCGDLLEILSFEFEYFLIILMTVDSSWCVDVSKSLFTIRVDGLLEMLERTFDISCIFFCSNSWARCRSSFEFWSDFVIWKAAASSSEIAKISSFISINMLSIWILREDFYPWSSFSVLVTSCFKVVKTLIYLEYYSLIELKRSTA